MGVDCLPNDAQGRLPGGPALSGALTAGITDEPLHPGQVSAVFPGYPRPIAGESAAATRYRRDRDGAHVDGLLPVGGRRRRMMREPHAYILGLPLTAVTSETSPLVVWEGSHEIIREAFRAALAGTPVAHWGEVDLTETYHVARRRCFESCARVEIIARPGEALLLDPLILHGITPWRGTGSAPRIVAYFRPMTTYTRWIAGEGAHGLLSHG